MITNIKINGFKSFQNFEMEFAPFTVIAGANASGKSNLFDALMLLARLAETDNLKKAFKEQRGEFIELFTQYTETEYASEMQFCVEMLINKDVKDAWGNEAKLKYTRLKYQLHIKRFTNTLGIEDLSVVYEYLENFKHNDDNWISNIPKKQLENWRPKVGTGKRGIPYIRTVEDNEILTVEVPQDGTTGNKRRFPLNNATRTVLSSFDTVDFPHVFAAREEMKSWKFLQLNPEDLRQPTSKEDGTDIISQSGKNLATVLYRIKQEDEYNLIEISRNLQRFLPHFIEVIVVDDKENKQYIIKLKDNDKKEYSSRVLSEGTLRILALCILEYDSQHTGLLCFEEPENGIHPSHIKDMVELLRNLSVDFTDIQMPLRQVIVNTHSPIFVGKIIDYIINDNNAKSISVNLSRMTKLVTTINNKRIDISKTRIENPLLEYKKTELGGMFTINENINIRKNLIYTIQQYLETSDFNELEDRLKKIKSNLNKHSVNS